MSNITDEVGKEVFTKIENLLKFFVKDISKILQEMQKQHNDRNKQNELLQELKNRISEYEKQLSQIDKTTQYIDFEEEHNFKELCETTFSQAQDDLINCFKEQLDKRHDYLIEYAKKDMFVVSTEQKEQFICRQLEETDINDLLESCIYEENWNTSTGIKGFFEGYKENGDLSYVIKEYCKEYEDCDWNDYITEEDYLDREGYINTRYNIDFEKLIQDTEIENDILRPFVKQLIEDSETQRETQNEIHKLISQHDKEDIQNYIDSFGDTKGTENITKDIIKRTDDFER